MSDNENWGDDDENDPDYVPPDEIENGHVTSNTDEDLESTGMQENLLWFAFLIRCFIDEENPGTSGSGQFDTDLPTTHRVRIYQFV